ncbi:MAG: hypothetical protein K5648_07600 [Erysipelotrichaceae bacterium]|nr:hypothetical protein [Erysipelotrichaceae bacterium]
MSPIGKSIRSRATGSPGIITGITRDKLSVSFRYSGIVELPIKKYEELLEMNSEVREAIEQFRESVKRSRKKKAYPETEMMTGK